MAVFFTAASSQYLLNSAPPIVDYPFTVGMWMFPTALGAIKGPFTMADSGTTNHYLQLRLTNTDLIGPAAAAGGVATVGLGTTDFLVSQWCYGVARFIGSTERRGTYILNGANFIEHCTASSASRVPTSMDNWSIGGRASSTPGDFMDGAIAEFWIAEGDIGSSGLDLPLDMVHRLAFGGPFSVPHIAAKIVEYRSFKQGIASDSDRIGHVYNRGVRQTWTAVNGPLRLAPHPPLPYWYKRPGQVKRNLVI